MEIINKLNLKYIAVALLFIVVVVCFYAYKNYSDLNKTKSYFDLYLANTYNELDEAKITSNTSFLSNIKNTNVSFFANLKLGSLSQIKNYDNFEKDLIILKNSILNNDLMMLSEIKDGVFFNETASIYYLNSNLNNVSKEEFDKNSNNFFTKAVSLYLNDN